MIVRTQNQHIYYTVFKDKQVRFHTAALLWAGLGPRAGLYLHEEAEQGRGPEQRLCEAH